MKKIITLFAILCISHVFAQENSAIACSDGIDNDGDGQIDCLDGECGALPNDGCSTCGEGITFADSVIEYLPGCPTNIDEFPESTLGVSDAAADETVLYLGEGGILKLGFTNNLLTNSGNSDDDLFVFEVGVLVEDCTLAFRPADGFTETQLQNTGILDANGDGFYEFGSVGGATAGYDIDSDVTGHNPGVLIFDAVELTDVIDLSCPANTPGADIDAVCALSSAPLSIADNSKIGVYIYPNPTEGKLSVALDKAYQKSEITITNMLGQTIMESGFDNQKILSLNLNIPSGIYFLILKADGQTHTERIIKK